MANTMKAWQFQTPGPLEQTLTLVDNAPRPDAGDLGPRDVLVKVIAASLNPADYKIVEFGFVARAFAAFPNTAAMDVSGEVLAVGAGLAEDDVKVGSKILGRVHPLKAGGALSQYVVVSRTNLAVLPDRPDVDAVVASGLATAGLTAYGSIVPYVEAGRGDKIFINGGSGGVGTFCIQVAKLLGCHVTVSCSTGKVELCKSLGADDIIDYKTTNVTEALKQKGRVFTLIVDNVGNGPPDLYSASRDYLGSGNPYLFVGGNPSWPLARNLVAALLVPASLGGVRGSFRMFMAADDPKALAELTRWYAEGRLKILVDSTFGFGEGKVAMQKLRAGGALGKIIVTAEE